MKDQEIKWQHLTEVFQEMETSMNGKFGTPFHEFQKTAFTTLQEVDFPNRKHEDWKYTSVQKIMAPKYTLAPASPASTLPKVEGLDAYRITIVNGRAGSDVFSNPLEEKGVRIYTLEKAFQLPDWKEVFANALGTLNPNSNKAFDFLNFSFTTNGLFLDFPKGLQLDKPVEICVIHDNDEISFSHPLLFARFGQECAVTIFERFENIAGPVLRPESLINMLSFYHLERGAQVKHIKWQNLGAHQNMVYKLMISQLRDSHFTGMAFDYGGLLTRNNVEADMTESNTFTSLEAGFIANGKQSMDHQTRIHHLVHHCVSHEHYKGIIDDQASAAFNGKVYVHPDAQKTNAYQQNDTLVLSANAVMNSKPQLEIYADDVKCSHGATIGQLDDKALFYLKARGIHPDQATHILKAAFLATILENIPHEAIRNYITIGMSI